MREALEELACAKASAADRLPAAIEAAARESQFSSEIFLLTTRPADQLDVTQLASLQLKRSHPSAGRVQVISTAEAQCNELFQME
jgi:hypothetical protein